MPTQQCDHCKQPVSLDRNGWFVGDDATSDCPADPRGHEVDEPTDPRNQPAGDQEHR